MNKQVGDSRLFKRGRALAYLEEQDRYLTASAAPDFAFGFIGCGMMGQEHIRNALLVGRATVGGLFDPSAKSIHHASEWLEKTQNQPKPRIYATLHEACADPDTDALIIATPNFTHLDVMRIAAGCDKAIFLEKPIATTVADAYEVCRLAMAHNRTVRFGLQYRYKAIYAEAISEVFERNNVGRVHSVNMLEHRFPFLDKVGQWNKFSDYTGGTLIEKCCHYFDLMNLFAGSTPRQVFAVGHQAVNFRDFTYDNKKADGLDQAQVTIRYENDVVGGFSLCMFAPGSREELIVCGDTGRLQASEHALLGAVNENRVEVWRGENGASRTNSPSYPDYIAQAGHHGSTFFEHVSFAEELSNREFSGPSFADGFWSVVVGAAAQISIERGDAVDVAEVLPEHFDSGMLGSPGLTRN